MVAYWVARSKVNNPDQYKKYTELVPDILQKFGGKVLARGGKFKILEGSEKFRRFIVIEFPNFEKAVACYESPEYLQAAAHRQKDGASELDIAISKASETTSAERHADRHPSFRARKYHYCRGLQPSRRWPPEGNNRGRHANRRAAAAVSVH